MTSPGTNLQKKLFDYARDYAFDKIGKKLEKAQAKQHDRLCPNHNNKNDDQSSTITPENCRIFIGNESAVSEMYEEKSKRFCEKSELNSMSKRSQRTDIAYIQIPTQSEANTTTIHGNIKSAIDDDDYLTAEEEDENDMKMAKEFIKFQQKRKQICRKSGILMELPSSNNGTEYSEDDHNHHLQKERKIEISSMPETPISPHLLHQHGSSAADYSGYIQKKSLAQGMMDLALVSANTNQLRYILEYQNHHPYFGTSLTLVILSLVLQVVVGMTLIWNTRFNVKKRNEMKEADRVNNISVIGIFMVTLINVFLSTFGGAPQNPSNFPTTTESGETTIDNADDEHHLVKHTTEPMIYH